MDSQPIGTVDALFLTTEQPTTLNNMVSLSIHDPSTAPNGFVRLRDVLHYLDSRIHIAPQWRQKLIYNPLQLEEPRLVDDPDFDLEFHVRHIALPSPHDERQLKILSARIASRPMDPTRPLWEMYVIEGLDNCETFPPNSFAILLKMHHAVFDGEAALKALEAMYQQTPDEVAPSPTEPWEPKPAPSLIDWVTGSTTHYFKKIADTVTSVPNISKSAWAEGEAIVKNLRDKSAKEAVPSTRFQAPVTSHRVFDWITVPIDRFTAVREALGKPKINDLMLAIVGGGLRRYLDSHGELPEETLVALCPINLRPKDAAAVQGNLVTLMRLPCGTSIADPVARMKHIAAESAAKKEHVSKTGGTLAVDVLGMVPYPVRTFIVKNLASLMGTGKMKPVINTVLTNVPAPPGEFFFAGARLVIRVGMAPMFSYIGLTNLVSTTSHEAMFAATSCREIMPDIAHYMECISESFDEFEKIALGRGASPSAGR